MSVGLAPSVALAAGDADSFDYSTLTASAAIVVDGQTGNIVLAKNFADIRAPASLTKLVSALTYLSLNPDLKKKVSIGKKDEVGGARLSFRAKDTFSCRDLLYVSLIASTNNTTNALVTCSGLKKADFVARMNEMAQKLGARQSSFAEPTGIDVQNQISAVDYVRILAKALTDKQILDIVNRKNYNFSAANNGKSKYSIKTTDQLLSDKDLTIIGGKTGYINESRYNFAAEATNSSGRNIYVVVLGAKNRAASFAEAKSLALWAWQHPTAGTEYPSLVFN